jgi:hypothetical protein
MREREFTKDISVVSCSDASLLHVTPKTQSSGSDCYRKSVQVPEAGLARPLFVYTSIDEVISHTSRAEREGLGVNPPVSL